MALIVITINDNANGDADLSVLCEPQIPTDPDTMMTSAQVTALNMLRAAVSDAPVKQDRGLIQLIN